MAFDKPFIVIKYEILLLFWTLASQNPYSNVLYTWGRFSLFFNIFVFASIVVNELMKGLTDAHAHVENSRMYIRVLG